jgi:hypothetical protein
MMTHMSARVSAFTCPFHGGSPFRGGSVQR